MINMMKLAVTTACVWPNDEPIHYLRDSCKRYGVALRPYGIAPDAGYSGWLDIKVRKLLPFLEQLNREQFTHLLYTDGRDSFFLADAGEAILNYRFVGSPACLMAAESEPHPFPELGVAFPDPGHRFRYLCAGQYIAEIPWLLNYWPKLLSEYAQYGDNDQAGLTVAFLDGSFPGMKLDTACAIFQSVGNGNAGLGTDLIVSKHRLFNKVTNRWPVIAHFNGGYSDPVIGKDAAMLPLWDEIGGWPA